MRFSFVVAFILLFLSLSLSMLVQKKDDSIKIGLLYSKTGTMATEERVIAQMVEFAVEEINKNGGIDNKRVKIIKYDGASDPKIFAQGAEFLAELGIKTIFGCWTSASRVAVKPIIEKNNITLIYPVQFEGFEESDNIIYLGATPNQQINPTLSYIKKHYGESIYVVGSDYIYPQYTNVYIQELAKKIPLLVLGSSFEPLGSKDFSKAIKDIKKLKPKAIINLINGDSNIAFFQQLYEANLSSREYPVFSMSMDESSIKQIASSIGDEKIVGHYLTNSYLMSINTDENRKLIQKLKTKFGEHFILTDPGYFSYLGVKLWKGSYKRAKLYGLSLSQVIKTQSIDSTLGVVYIDDATGYTYKNIHIGKITQNGTYIAWKSHKILQPHAYKSIHSKEIWQKLLNRSKETNNE